MYAIINSTETLEAALKLARGCYQRNLLLGHESLSGATIRGRAKQWGSRYAESRRNLLRRCLKAGLAISETIGDHNKRLLVIG